jgi:hypothetical protein
LEASITSSKRLETLCKQSSTVILAIAKLHRPLNPRPYPTHLGSLQRNDKHLETTQANPNSNDANQDLSRKRIDCDPTGSFFVTPAEVTGFLCATCSSTHCLPSAKPCARVVCGASRLVDHQSGFQAAIAFVANFYKRDARRVAGLVGG